MMLRAITMALLLLALVACGGEQEDASVGGMDPVVGEGSVTVGEPAPTFRLPATDGSVVDLSEMKGQVVVLNFWATWCAPCRVEMPELQAAYQANQEDGLRIVAIEIRASGSAEESAGLLEERGVRFPNVRDASGLMEERFIRRPAWPTTIFIDREGIVRYVQVGPMTKEFIEERLSELGF